MLSKAFTLVEILIALAIVAVFITLPVFAYSTYASSQRDIKRKSDLNQIQQALVQYKASTGKYPTTNEFPNELIESGYLPKMLIDPQNGRTNNGISYGYNYISNGVSYTLSTLLENKDKNATGDEESFYVLTQNGAATTINSNPLSGYPTNAPLAQNTQFPTGAVVATKSPTPTRTPTKTKTPTPPIVWDEITETNSPPARVSNSTAIWDGTRLIVWGMDENSNATGGMYNPSTDTWTATATTNAPSVRTGHCAVWTGSKMIIWGGQQGGQLNTGGMFDPVSNTWAATATTNAPSGRAYHGCVWTGTHMVVWGGLISPSTYPAIGGIFDPEDGPNGSWTSMAESPINGRKAFAMVWTGSEVIVFGGDRSTLVSDGALYNPDTDTWRTMNTTGAPKYSGTYSYTTPINSAVWTGSTMLLWSGSASSTPRGGIYDPVTNSWTSMSSTDQPASRVQFTSVWTGSKYIVWGGSNLNSGGMYDPTTDTWTETSTTNAPIGRLNHAAVWTGSRMLLWGGTNSNTSQTFTDGFLFYVSP